jgi:hypothetical protein
MQKGREGEEQKRREQRRRERREGVNKRKKRRSGMVAARKAGTLFSCLEMFLAVSPQPLVREAG